MKATAMKHSFSITTFALVLAMYPWAMASGQTLPAEKDPAHVAHHGGEAKSADSAYAEAEVRKVDKEGGKITLKHGPIPNLDMPPMSMVFRAKDPAMLGTVKAGDKIRFKAEKIQGAYTVTEIQPAK